MTILSRKDFKKKHNLKDDSLKESELQRVFNHPIKPRDTKIYSDRRFVNIDNELQAGTHWSCFYIKDNRTYYFDSFGGQPDRFLLNELPKPIIQQNFEIQDVKSKTCGSYCVKFFYLIERMNYFDTILKTCFG